MRGGAKGADGTEGADGFESSGGCRGRCTRRVRGRLPGTLSHSGKGSRRVSSCGGMDGDV